MTKIYKDDKFFDFDAISGWEDLINSVKEMPEEYTKLVPDLGDADPDDAFSSIPYEKGFHLLYSLEKMVGLQSFGEFTKAYFDKYKFSVVTSELFREFVQEYFQKDYPQILEFDWDTWLYQPGLPAKPYFDRTLSSACENLAEAWMAVEDDASKVPPTDISTWSTSQKICFLDAILATCSDRNQPLSLQTVRLMKQSYQMHETHNSEVLHRFCMICVAAGDTSIIPVVIRFITTQGRMKFVRPLYRALFASKMGKTIAVRTFVKHRDFYHPVCAKMLAKDLEIDVVDGSVGGEKKKNGSIKSRKNLLVGACIIAASVIGIALYRGKRR